MKICLRQIVALLCLVALMCGGQATACACDIMPPAAACESHDHSGDHDKQHDHSKPGDDAQCPCATCHSCTHLPIALPGVGLPTLESGTATSSQMITARLTVRGFDIFIPPKIG